MIQLQCIIETRSIHPCGHHCQFPSRNIILFHCKIHSLGTIQVLQTKVILMNFCWILRKFVWCDCILVLSWFTSCTCHYDGPFTANLENALWKALPFMRLISWNVRNLSGASKRAATIAYILVATLKHSMSQFYKNCDFPSGIEHLGVIRLHLISNWSVFLLIFSYLTFLSNSHWKYNEGIRNMWSITSLNLFLIAAQRQ